MWPFKKKITDEEMIPSKDMKTIICPECNGSGYYEQLIHSKECDFVAKYPCKYCMGHKKILALPKPGENLR